MMSTKVKSDSELLYAGDRFEVRSVLVSGRGDKVVRRQVVRPSNAVLILPVLAVSADSAQVLLIRNHRFAVGQCLWELPAGTIEIGEEPEACARRELLEETGYEADKLLQLLEFYPSPGFCTEMLTAFLAQGLTFKGQQLDATEQITTEVLSLKETMQMIRCNEIRDAKTIATLLYYQKFLLRSEG